MSRRIRIAHSSPADPRHWFQDLEGSDQDAIVQGLRLVYGLLESRRESPPQFGINPAPYVRPDDIFN